MASKNRTLVTFSSLAFNVTTQKPNFINEGCFGEDVARWLIGELREQGVQTEENVAQEDFGWYLGFRLGNLDYQFVITYRPDNQEAGATWVGWLERSRGFVGSLLGTRKRGIHPAAAAAVHRVLASSPQIGNVRWHFQTDFDEGFEERGTAVP